MPTLAADEMRRRLDTQPVAYLATVRDDGRPHVVPVCFAWCDGALVSAVDAKPKRSTELRRLANVRTRPEVSLLADHYDEDWAHLWWVRVDGHARLLEPGPGHAEAVAALVDRYPQYRDHPPAGTVLWITPHAWRGWAAT